MKLFILKYKWYFIALAALLLSISVALLFKGEEQQSFQKDITDWAINSKKKIINDVSEIESKRVQKSIEEIDSNTEEIERLESEIVETDTKSIDTASLEELNEIFKNMDI